MSPNQMAGRKYHLVRVVDWLMIGLVIRLEKL